METEYNDSKKIEKRVDSCCIADLTIEKIIVYLDKAEITRSIKYDILEGQILECTFEQLPSTIDKDSIRIEVQNKYVSIQDVTFNVRPINDSSEQMERLRKIKELIKTEKQIQDSLEAKKSRLSKQKHVLDAFANTLIDSNSVSKECAPTDFANLEKEKINKADAYNPKHLETIGNFFQLYNDNGERFDESLLEIDEKFNQSMAKVGSYECERKEIEIRQDEQLYRELYVIVERSMEGEFEMNISYVVNNCSWRPIYDVRVSNNTGSMQINYYGIIKQKCGEDWYQPQRFNLSTAEPGVGGTVPDVGIQKVQFKNQLSPSQEVPSTIPFSPTLSTSNLRKSTSRLSFRKSRVPSTNTFDFNTTNGTSPFQNIMYNENQKSFDNKETPERINGKQFNSISTSFEIARPPFLVTCDEIEFKVMIAVIYIEPHYQHVTIPKYSPYAYLRSIATNTSKYTFLEGPVNIYIDSNFIGKTQLTTISPCEEFFCNLGVDKGVKVNYLPMFKYKENYQKSMSVTFKQEIQVTNNHERPIKILVIDQLPLSNDEKIKVTLIEPNIKNLDKYDKQKPIRINPNRQIEWDCEIGSKNKKEMTLKFTVEHPYGREIEVTQLK